MEAGGQAAETKLEASFSLIVRVTGSHGGFQAGRSRRLGCPEGVCRHPSGQQVSGGLSGGGWRRIEGALGRAASTPADSEVPGDPSSRTPNTSSNHSRTRLQAGRATTSSGWTSGSQWTPSRAQAEGQHLLHRPEEGPFHSELDPPGLRPHRLWGPCPGVPCTSG